MRDALVLLGVSAALAVTAPAMATAATPPWSAPVHVAEGWGWSTGIDARGAVTVAWGDLGPDPGHAFVAELEPGSERFGTPLALGRLGSSVPQVAVNESGASVVAWLERPESCTIFDCRQRLGIRIRQPRASDFGAARYLTEDATEVPEVALSESGHALVAWPGPGGTISAVLGTVTGGFGAPALVKPPTGENWPPKRGAAIGENGAALVSWMTFNEPVQASYRAPGGGFGPAEVVSRVDPADGLGVALDPRGVATVAFVSNGDSALHLASRPRGGSFRPGRSLGATRVSDVEMDQDASGNQLLYWSRQTSPNHAPDPIAQTYASFRDAGGEWGDPVEILPPKSLAVLRLDRMGNAHAVWSTRVSARRQPVRGGTLTRFGVMERPQLLSESAAASSMAVNRAGAAVAVFTESVDTGTPQPKTLVRVTTREADERPARLRLMRVSLGAAVARVRARCDEPCRLRGRVAGQGAGSATVARPMAITLRTGRRGTLRVRLSRRTRARLLAGRRVKLVVRATDGAGNVRTVRRRLSR